jgi:hypothetical protein
MKKFMLIGLSSFVLFATSCKKDSEDTSTVTKEHVAGNYKLTASTVKVGSSAEQDLMIYMDACDKDDIIALKTDLTYTITDAGIKCSPTNDDNGTWSLPSTTTIKLDSDTFTISSFDGSKLVLTEVDNSTPGTTYVYTTTFTKQ